MIFAEEKSKDEHEALTGITGNAGRAKGKAVQKEALLKRNLSAYPAIVVAFSGGVDSTYLLHLAVRAVGPERVLAVTVQSPLVDEKEVRAAASEAFALSCAHHLASLDLLALPVVRNNQAERCYHCKKAIYKHLLDVARRWNEGALLLDGTNADDAQVNRPGIRALRELNVLMPLMEAGLTKEEIRMLSRHAGLATWDKPAASCLATRFPPGERLEPGRLQRVAAAEGLLRTAGLKGVLRVRCAGDEARIEAEEGAMGVLLCKRGEIIPALLELGFKQVCLDLQGYRTGSMDL